MSADNKPDRKEIDLPINETKVPKSRLSVGFLVQCSHRNQKVFYEPVRLEDEYA